MKHLKPEMYFKAVSDAEKDIRASHPEPAFKTYKSYRISDYPREVTIALLIGLTAIWLGAMVISITKLSIATDMAFKSEASILDMTIATLSIFSFSEFGVIVFSLASTIFTGRAWQIIFRTLAIACAMTAIITNWTVLLLSWQSGVEGFQGYIAFFVPCLTVGIGLFLERLLAGYLVAHKMAKTAFEDAHRIWREFVPQSDPGYMSALGRRVLDALTQWQGGPNSQARADFQAMRDDPETGHIFEAQTFRDEYEYQRRAFQVEDHQEAAHAPKADRPLSSEDRPMGLAAAAQQSNLQAKG